MRKSRFYTTPIIMLPMLALSVGSLVYLFSLGREAMSRLPDMIRETISARVQGEVQIGDIGMSPFALTLNDVHISDEHGPVANIPRIKVAYSLNDIIRRKVDPATSIRRIDVLKPEVFLRRDAKGRWNITNILKPSKPGKKPLKLNAKLYVKAGRFVVSDLKPNPSKVAVNILRDVDAVIDPTGLPSLEYSISGLGQPGRLERFKANGTYNIDKKSYNIALDVFRASANYWTTYPLKLNLKIPSGYGNGRILLAGPGRKKPIRYIANIDVHSASFKLGPIRTPMRDINGDLDIRNGIVSMNLKGRLGSTPMTVSGNILTKKNALLALELTSDRANLREMASLTDWSKTFNKVGLPRTGRVRATISGPTRSFRMNFNVDAPTLAFNSYSGRSVRVNGRYFDKHIVVEKASAETYGGKMNLHGDIDLSKNLSVELDGDVAGIKLGQIPALRKRQLSATSSGKFHASWKPRDLAVSYQGDVSKGQFAKFKFDKGAVAGRYANGAFQIHEINAETLGGLAAVSGDVARDGAVKLHVAGADIDLATIQKSYWKTPTVGKVQFVGEITGTAASPTFKGDVEAYKMAVSGIEVERIAGSVEANRKRVDLKDMVVYKQLGTMTVSGTINNPMEKSPKLALNVSADSIDIDGIAKIFKSPVLPGGSAFADINISGDFRNPMAEGKLRVEGASYREMPIDSLSAELHYADKNLKIDELTAKSGESTLTASGDILNNDRIDVKFNASRIGLNKLCDYTQKYAYMRGNLSASGRVEGSLKSPKVDLEADCQNLVINGQQFAQLHGRASWEKTIITVSDFKLTDDRSSIEIPLASYDTSSKLAALSVDLKDVSAGKIQALMDASPAPIRSKNAFLSRFRTPFGGTVNGSLTGSVRLSGKEMMPDLQAEIDVAGLKYGLSHVDTVRVKGQWQGKLVTLEKLEMLDGDTNVYAEGSLGPGDAVDLRLDAHSLSMDAVRQWVKIPHNFSGLADVTLIASGTTRVPVADISVEIVEPIIAGVKFDRVRSRLSTNKVASESASRIYIDDLTLVRGERDFSATGYLPVDWAHTTIPSDGSILLETKLDGDSLELLSAFSGIHAETDKTGSFEGSVKLEGTVRSPQLAGRLAWHDGRISLPKINQPLEKIDADVILMNDKLSVEKFTGVSAEGGSFTVAGHIALADLKPVMDLAVKTKNFAISGRNISNIYNEDVRAKIDSDLKISGGFGSPLISGLVSVPNGSLSLAGKAGTPGPAVARSIDPKFNIEVLLGRSVQFRSARLKSPMYGKVTIAGSLSKPLVDGSMDISDGTILFPLSQFKILPGSTMSLHYPPSQKSTMYVDMRAQGRMSSVSTLGKRESHTVTMVAQGPFDKLEPSFTSSPPDLSEQTILAMLTGQQQLELILTQNGNAGRITDLFQAAVMPTVFAPIEDAFKSVLGFDEFALEMGYREPLQLTVGNRLLDNFYLGYSAFLGSRPDYADSLYKLRLSYRFKHGVELGVDTDQNHTINIGVEGKLRF